MGPQKDFFFLQLLASRPLFTVKINEHSENLNFVSMVAMTWSRGIMITCIAPYPEQFSAISREKWSPTSARWARPSAFYSSIKNHVSCRIEFHVVIYFQAWMDRTAAEILSNREQEEIFWRLFSLLSTTITKSFLKYRWSHGWWLQLIS